MVTRPKQRQMSCSRCAADVLQMCDRCAADLQTLEMPLNASQCFSMFLNVSQCLSMPPESHISGEYRQLGAQGGNRSAYAAATRRHGRVNVPTRQIAFATRRADLRGTERHLTAALRRATPLYTCRSRETNHAVRARHVLCIHSTYAECHD